MIDCTDEQLMEEVRRRAFVIRDAQIGRKWVGLTDEEIKTTWGSYFSRGLEFAKAIEAKLKEKNA